MTEKIPDPVRPGWPIVLDKPRRLLFDLNALIALQEQTGKNMLSGEGWAQFGEPDPAQMRLLIWAGLLHEDPELTLEAAGALIHPGNLASIMAAVEGASGASLPEPDPLAGAAAPKRGRRRAGSNSGARRAPTSA